MSLLERHKNLFAVLALSAAILAVYSNTFTASFQFDDRANIIDNPLIKDMGNFFTVLTGPRGLTLATFMINYAIGANTNVVGYHIVNTAVHIGTAVALYFFLLELIRLAKEDAPWAARAAFFSALLFAVHPVQTQSVTYIVQRMEALSSLFYILGLLLFVKSNGAAGARKTALHAGVAASYVLGFYSKETAFTMPAVIFLLDLFFISKGGFKGIMGRWPLYAVLSVLLVLFAFNTIKPSGGFGDLSKDSAVTVEHGLAPSAPSQESAGFKVTGITPREYLYTEFNVLVYYMAFLVWPANQNLDYDFPKSSSLFETPVLNQGAVLNMPLPPPAVSLAILAAVVFAGAAFYALSLKRELPRLRLASFFIFWFFIILSPTSSFVPIIDFIYEHRLYLASAGFFTIFVLFTDWAASRAFAGRGA